MTSNKKSIETPELDEQIRIAEHKLSELKGQRRELKRLAKKSLRGRGREPLPEWLVEKAREMARIRPLKDTALSLGVSVTSLYNKGISRRAIDAESKIKDDL